VKRRHETSCQVCGPGRGTQERTVSSRLAAAGPPVLRREPPAISQSFHTPLLNPTRRDSPESPPTFGRAQTQLDRREQKIGSYPLNSRGADASDWCFRGQSRPCGLVGPDGDGRLAEEWIQTDNRSVLRQLGAEGR
jgi:hypothetical protein